MPPSNTAAAQAQAAQDKARFPSRGRPEPPPPPPKPDLERYVEVGDVVEWFAGGSESSPPWPGIVSQVGMDSAVNLNCVNAGYQSMHLKDGTVHMDHKNAKAGWSSAGGWRHRPLTVALRRLLLSIGLLKWSLKKNNEWELACTTADEFQSLEAVRGAVGGTPAATPSPLLPVGT